MTHPPAPVASWSVEIELRGGGGEPVNLARTLLSHGVADLPPNSIADDGSSLDSVLVASGRAWRIRLISDGAEGALLQVPTDSQSPPAAARRQLVAQLRHMLLLDEDLSAFYAAAAKDPSLSWVTRGAGRMLRSPTVFEDVIKTICTTNCTWAATERMVGALVSELGESAVGAPASRAFPTPAAVAEAPPDFYRDVARAGYRGPYLRSLGEAVAEGRLDLQALGDPARSDDDVARELLGIAGVGPYAMAHIMMLLGRYHRLILDSWTRPTYRRLSGRPRVTDKGIERAFRHYGAFAGLAFWLTLTKSWVTQADPVSAES